MPAFEAVLFDLWDTLVPSTKEEECEQVKRALNLPKLGYGRYLAHQRQEWFPTKMPAEQWFEHFLESEEVVPNRARIDLCVKAWEAARAEAEPFPESREVLKELQKRKLKLGLVSNTEVGTREAVIERLGLQKYFGAIVLSYEVGAAKPDPRPFHNALNQLGVPAERALFVGDRLAVDVIPARRVGIPGVLVDRKGGREYKPKHALAVVRDLRELLALL